MTLPVVRLTGSPHAQGVEHGRVLGDRISHNRDVYFARFEREVGLARTNVLALAAAHAERIGLQDPDYMSGMAGVAEGGGFDLLEIVALNIRYEILYYLLGKGQLAAGELPVDGCTAFAALPAATASGHLMMGQNWDWIPEIAGAVLHTTDEDGFETLAYTESGIVGAKIGLNGAGLGLCVNGMLTLGDDWSRPVRPFHVRCYRMLRCRDIDDARRVVADEPRALAANFLLAQPPDRVLDLEAAPDRLNVLPCGAEGSAGGGCVLTHANHFTDPVALGVAEVPNPRRVYSVRRAARLRKLLEERLPLTVERVQEALRDTQDDPFGLCRHRDRTVPPEQQYTTVTSVVMDLDTRTLHISDGPPDAAPYQTATLRQ